MQYRKGFFGVTLGALLLAGCGGLTNSSGSGGSYAGLYRSGFTRGTSTVSVSVDGNGNAKMVITDDQSKFPSFTGTGTVTTVNGTGTLNVNLNGSDGSVATATGAFGASGSTTNLTLNVSGGVGTTGLVMNQVTPSTVYAHSWSGNQTFVYTTSTGASKPASTPFTYTIALANDGVTLNLTGGGSTIDPNGVAATASIVGTVDPSGLYNETTTYTYAGSTPPVTVTFSGYVNVDFATGLTMEGSQTGTWPNAGPTETDSFTFTLVAGTGTHKSLKKH